MKNFTTIMIEMKSAARLEFRGYDESMDKCCFRLIDGANDWDCAYFFTPRSELNALNAAITAFNSAYAAVKEHEAEAVKQAAE
jgi:hypothetical protein